MWLCCQSHSRSGALPSQQKSFHQAPIRKVKVAASTRAARFKLNEVEQRLLEYALSDEDRVNLNAKKSELQKLAKMKITSGAHAMDITRLAQAISEGRSLKKYNESGGRVNNVSAGLYQAGVLISKCFNEVKS